MSFPELIEYERTNKKLDAKDASRHVRRRLLKGDKLTADEVAELTGKTPTLLGAILSVMEEWGFIVARAKDPADENGKAGRTRYWLSNPDHVPVEKVNPRNRKASGTLKPKDKDRIRRRLLKGDTVSLTKLQKDYPNLTGQALGKIVKSLRDADYQVEVTKTGDGTEYRIGSNQERLPAIIEDDTPVDPPPTNGHHHQHHMEMVDATQGMPVPTVDEMFKVFMVFRDPQTQDVRMALQGKDGPILVTVDGHADLFG